MGPLTGQHLRCPKCQKEFVPKGADKPIIRTGWGPEAKALCFGSTGHCSMHA